MIIVLQQGLTEEHTSKALIIFILEGWTDIIVYDGILFALAQSLLYEVLHDFYGTILQACTLISACFSRLRKGNFQSLFFGSRAVFDFSLLDLSQIILPVDRVLLKPFGKYIISRDNLRKDIYPEGTIFFKAYLCSLEIICIDIRSFDATEEVTQECFIFLPAEAEALIPRAQLLRSCKLSCQAILQKT